MLLLVAAGLLWVSRRPPVLVGLDPNHAAPSEPVSVMGRNLGESGRLEIDGVALDQSVVRTWTDNMIVFVMPEDVRSGMVRVRTQYGASNALFLTNERDVPSMVQDQRVRVRNVSRAEAGPGTVVTVQGENFGPRTARSELGFYYPETGDLLLFPGNSWWIMQWTNRFLQFMVPSDLPAGTVYLVVSGTTLVTDLAVRAPTAVVESGQPRTFVLKQEVQFEVPHRVDPSAIHVVLPRVPVLPEQPEVNLREEAGEPTGEDTASGWVYHGEPVGTFQGDGDPSDGEGEQEGPWTYHVTREDTITRLGRRWEIQSVAPVETLLQPDFQRAFQRFLTDADGVPVYDATVGQIRQSSINLRNTPLVIARLIHREVQRRLEPDPDGTRDLAEALEGAPAASIVYADLAAALARVSALPARRHFGLVVADDGSLKDHVWLDVFLPGVGWVPMDPAFGDSMFGEEFQLARSFYGDNLTEDTLGALDGSRITVYVDGMANPSLFTGGATIPAEGFLYAGTVPRLEAARQEVLESLQVEWARSLVPVLLFQN